MNIDSLWAIIGFIGASLPAIITWLTKLLLLIHQLKATVWDLDDNLRKAIAALRNPNVDSIEREEIAHVLVMNMMSKEKIIRSIRH